MGKTLSSQCAIVSYGQVLAQQGQATAATCPKTEPWKEASGLLGELNSISAPSMRDRIERKSALRTIRGGHPRKECTYNVSPHRGVSKEDVLFRDTLHG